MDSLLTIQKSHTPEPFPMPGVPTFLRHGGAGQTMLWTAFTVLLVSSVIFMLSAFRMPAKKRLFHHVTFFITFTAMMSYYAMAQGMGKSYVPVGNGHHHATVLREVYWARYADWLITTPLLLLDLGLLAGLPIVDMILVIAADIGMIVTGVIAALDSKDSKWGFYVFSCIFFLYILYTLLYIGHKTAFALGDRVGKLYSGLSIYTAILWLAYPIVFVVSEGLSKITPTQEIFAYGILDILAKAVFGFVLLVSHASLDVSATYPDSWLEPTVQGGYSALSQEDA